MSSQLFYHDHEIHYHYQIAQDSHTPAGAFKSKYLPDLLTFCSTFMSKSSLGARGAVQKHPSMPEFNRFHILDAQEQILRLRSLGREHPLLRLPKVEDLEPEHLCTKQLWLPIAATIFLDKLEALQRQLNMAKAGQSEGPKIKPEWEEVGLKTLLWIAQAVFMDRNTYPEKIYDHALNVTGKKLLRASARQDNANVRQLLGENLEIWQAYAELLSLALPVLESQSLAPEEPINSTADSSSALLISTHYATLMKDLERLDDLLLIGRNILASTSLAQSLAGDSGIGRQVLKLIDVCVRVTTRGYDGEAGARITEAQWTNISAACKLDPVCAERGLSFFSDMALQRQETACYLPPIPQQCRASE